MAHIIHIKNENGEVIKTVEVKKFISPDSTTFDLLGAPDSILWEDYNGNYWLTDPMFSYNFDEVVAVQEAWLAERNGEYNG